MTSQPPQDRPAAATALQRRNPSTGFRLYYALAGLIPGRRRKIRHGLAPRRMTIMGCEFDLHPAVNATEFRMYRNARPPEWTSIETLQDVVAGKKCLFLDVGANIGVYSVFLGSKMAADSSITAFEPNPEVAARLAINLAMNGLRDMVRIEGVALGSEDSTGTLSVSRRNQGASSLAISQGDNAQDLEIPIRRLSAYLPAADEHEVWVLKADVEGYEDRALASILEPGQLRRPDYILLEISHSEHWQRDLLSEMRELGYSDVAEMDGNLLLKLGESVGGVNAEP